MESNPAYYEKIAVRIQEILDKYKDSRLSEEEKLKHAKDIRSMLMSENNENKNNYPDSIKNNKCAMAFYDNIGLYINEKTNESNHNTELVTEPKAIYGEIKKEKNITENIAIKLNEIFKEVFKKNPEVKKKLWGGEFWTDGYYISTVGMHGNETVIKYYVKNQGKEKEYKQLHYQKPRTQMTLF
jgi:REP element-mobilizing transposase RayT